MKTERVYKDFGARIRSLRQMKFLTQAELAKRCRLTRTSIVNIEAGRQRILLHDVRKFADALAFKAESLIHGIL